MTKKVTSIICSGNFCDKARRRNFVSAIFKIESLKFPLISWIYGKFFLRQFFIFILINNLLLPLSAKAKMYEKDYVNQYCGGYIEYVLPDKTRVDCLTEEYAIEFDYAKKWAESIGQSLYYAKKTGKKPAVAIILKKPSDEKYVKRIIETDKDITIFKIPANENKNLCN